MMKVLWLGQSNDTNERIPEHLRSINVAATKFTEATGLPVESEFRTLWPSPELPDLVHRWLGRYEPDMVVIHVNSYWFTYESVPARVERLLGPLGRPVALSGLRVAANPTLSENPVFRTARRVAARLIGGDVTIKAPECLEMLEDIVRQTVAREETVVFLRGPERPHDSTRTLAGHRRAAASCRYVSDGLDEICERQHVTYWKREIAPRRHEESDAMLGDRVHITADEHAVLGVTEAEWMVRAWQSAHPLRARTAP